MFVTLADPIEAGGRYGGGTGYAYFNVPGTTI
jgi:hypothetical protein